MLRSNLSSRPFYNERLVSLAIGIVALAAAALTAFNAYELNALSKKRTDLKTTIDRDTAQAQQIEREAATLQRTVNRATLIQLAGSTQEANTLIDQRTFSWTVFLGLVEKTMPFDLRLIAVRPRIEKGNIRVTMTVIAKRLEEIDTFVDGLQGTGAFYDLLPRNRERNEDDNTYRADVVANYLAPGQAPAATPSPSPAPTRAPAASKGKS